MKKFSKFISNHNILILIVSILLLIPSIYFYLNTRINYDILVYLPEKIDTIKGQNILANDFGLGSYAYVMIDTKDESKLSKMEDNIRDIKGVNEVISIYDLIGTTIPKDMLPDKVIDKLYDDDTTIMMVTFKDNTSDDTTIEAVRSLRKEVGDASRVSSMTSMVIDTMDLSDSEMLTYIVIAVILCLIVLTFATDSYVIPGLLLLNIGMAIVYNMGTNIFFGQISYITKAIVAVLQLGVTTDFSIFLYHKYMMAKRKMKDKKEAMASAIKDTFQSVIGSSLIEDLKTELVEHLDVEIEVNSVKEYYIELLKLLLEYFYKNLSTYSSIAIVKKNNNSIAFDMMFDASLEAVTKRLKEHYINKSNIPIEVISLFYVSGVTKICTEAIKDSKEFSPDKIISYLEALLPEIDYLEPKNV